MFVDFGGCLELTRTQVATFLYRIREALGRGAVFKRGLGFLAVFRVVLALV